MRFIIYALLIYLLYRMIRGKAAPEVTTKSAGTETHQDPVCGVFVSEADAIVGKLEGKRYHFCSMQCTEQFEKSQQR